MGWIEKRTEKSHYCFKPTYAQVQSENISIGSVWKCNDCGSEFVYAGLHVSYDKTHVFTSWFARENWNFDKNKKKYWAIEAY